MKLRNLLEGLSPTLYHSTNFLKGISILEKDKFVLSKTIESGIHHKTDEIRKNPYYLSMARTVQSSFVKKTLRNGGYIFELDGSKLSENHKGKPLDYFNFYSHKRRLELAKQSKYKEEEDLENPNKDNFLFFFENEDRLYSKKPEIDNFSKYIKAVHIVVIRNNSLGEVIIRDSQIKELIRDPIKKLNPSFPVYLYDNKRSINFLDKRKAEKL